VIILLGLGLTELQAQESINTTGGDASGSGGSVSYSVGQVAYQTYTGTNGSVAQGVQQPYEFSVLTAIEEAKGINLSVSAYPNPASDFLVLEIKDIELSDLSYRLYNTKGNYIQNEKITGSLTNIDMSNLMPAIYFVKVIQNKKDIKTFKIIKK
jgi:hypothetical protein